MIKIVHVCSDTNIGGAGRYLLNLIQEADKEVFELVVVLPKKSKLKALLEKAGGSVIESNLTPDQSFKPRDILVMCKLIRRLKPDIIHTHANLSARIAAKLIGIKGVVYTRHYVDTTSITGNTTARLGMKAYLKRQINNGLCDGVIGVAKECLPILLEMGIDESKIVIIPNGVTPVVTLTEADKLTQRKRYDIEQNQQVITIMARLSKEKGHTIFLHVIKKLIEEAVDVVGLIVGIGKEEASIREQVKALDLEKHIRMVGFIEKVEEPLNITTIQMNTSYTEAQSLALSEGMSIGIPAVVTDVGGNGSMITHGKNGYVAPSEDVDKLAYYVKKLLEDQKLYEQMCLDAKACYEKKYTAKEMTKQTEIFYRNVLNKKR